MPVSTRPFLKWPGGKRWLLPYVQALLERCSFERYIEPFLGGGAIFFGLSPAHALLSDINADLIRTYEQVRARPQAVVERVARYSVDAETYEQLRRTPHVDPLEATARFLYLNRTAFGGMYRLNREGRFNVPFGGGQRTPEPLWRDGLLMEAAQALQAATLRSDDFGVVLAEAGRGDLVYCDPTYTVAHNNNGFVRYNERNFSWGDQWRLARGAADAAERGAFVLVSNAAHADVVDLYPNAHVHVVTRWSKLCPTPAARRRTQELLIVLTPHKRTRRYFGNPAPEIRRGRRGGNGRSRPTQGREGWPASAVKELRSSLGLTQAELARYLRVSRSAISGWETGAYVPRRRVWGALDSLATSRADARSSVTS